jgi:hypothetical protein
MTDTQVPALDPEFEGCPYCALSFRASRLRQHLRTVHPAMVGLKAPPPASNESARETQSRRHTHQLEVIHCIRCGAEVLKQHFDAHFFAHTTFGKRAIALERAGLSPSGNSRPTTTRHKPTDGPQLRPDLVGCPYCTAIVGKKNLEKHCKKVHGKNAPLWKEAQLRKAGRADQSDENQQRNHAPASRSRKAISTQRACTIDIASRGNSDLTPRTMRTMMKVIL